MNGMLKAVSAVVIVLGGGYIGGLLASRYSVRVVQLRQLSDAMEQLGFNIGFLKMPAATALAETGRSGRGAISSILTHASEKIASGRTPSEAWEAAMHWCSGKLCLTDEDSEILSVFARSMGIGDVESELSNIKAASARLKLALSNAEAERDRMSRLTRGAGYLGGMLAAVILL